MTIPELVMRFNFTSFIHFEWMWTILNLVQERQVKSERESDGGENKDLNDIKREGGEKESDEVGRGGGEMESKRRAKSGRRVQKRCKGKTDNVRFRCVLVENVTYLAIKIKYTKLKTAKIIRRYKNSYMLGL